MLDAILAADVNIQVNILLGALTATSVIFHGLLHHYKAKNFSAFIYFVAYFLASIFNLTKLILFCTKVVQTLWTSALSTQIWLA